MECSSRVCRCSIRNASCLTEVYEFPYGGSHSRGIDIDSNGMVWTPLNGEGVLASSAQVQSSSNRQGATSEASATARQCSEGWPLSDPRSGLQIKTPLSNTITNETGGSWLTEGGRTLPANFIISRFARTTGQVSRLGLAQLTLTSPRANEQMEGRSSKS